jgi:hypothetical protein
MESSSTEIAKIPPKRNDTNAPAAQAERVNGWARGGWAAKSKSFRHGTILTSARPGEREDNGNVITVSELFYNKIDRHRNPVVAALAHAPGVSYTGKLMYGVTDFRISDTRSKPG